MAEQVPDTSNQPIIRPTQVARLHFSPNMVLFERLRPFYGRPETVERIGQHGLVLYSVASWPVVHRRHATSYEPGSGFVEMAQTDKVDHDLGHMLSNDRRLKMAEQLNIAKTDMGGVAIRMAVLMNKPVADLLKGTPFVNKDRRLIDVGLYVRPNQRAAGATMRAAADELWETLQRPDHPAGTESIELIVSHRG